MAGSLIGSWGAVAGAIAGTALTIYYSTKRSRRCQPDSNRTIAIRNLNPELFCEIVEKICESIDNIINTYRVQAKRIVNSYEQREQPTLLNTYSSLVEQIADVIEVSKSCEEAVPSVLKDAISLMEKKLGNYNLKFENGKIINA